MSDRNTTALAQRAGANGAEGLARLESTVPVRVSTEGIGLMTLCQSLVASGFFRDCRDASQAVVKVLYGQELGIAPVTAMMSIHVIEGKPAPSANLLAAMIKRARPLYDYRVATLTNDRCEVVFFEQGEEVGRTGWTLEDAKRAGLIRNNRDGSPGNWTKYPRPMLFARAISEGVRTYFPDLFGGAPVYTPEELGANVNPETGEVLDVPGVSRYGNTVDVTERVTNAAEQSASFATVATTGPSEEELRDLCGRHLVALGRKDKPARDYFLITLNHQVAEPAQLAIPSLKDWHDLEGWRRLELLLSQATQDQKRMFATYAEWCGLEGGDARNREERLRVLGEMLRRRIESSSDLYPHEFAICADWFQGECRRIRAEQANADETQPTTPLGVASEADPFESE